MSSIMYYRGDCESCTRKNVITCTTKVECAGCEDVLRLCPACGGSTPEEYGVDPSEVTEEGIEA